MFVCRKRVFGVYSDCNYFSTTAERVEHRSHSTLKPKITTAVHSVIPIIKAQITIIIMNICQLIVGCGVGGDLIVDDCVVDVIVIVDVYIGVVMVEASTVSEAVSA